MANTHIQIQRRLDELGRVVIPIEMREYLDIIQKDWLNIRLDGKKIIIEKVELTEQEKQEREKQSNLHRFVIPNNVLEKLGAKDQSEIDIQVDGEDIKLIKKQ